MVYTPEIKIKAGYRIIGLIAREILVSGMRIALSGELRSIKMLVDPEDCDPIDRELLGILEDPHVKLAFSAINYIESEIFPPYQLIYLWDDEEVLTDALVEKLAGMVFNRFIFWRSRPRRRDRYINFQKVLQTAQRVLYEWCKLMLQDDLDDEADWLPPGYRCNYSPGRLKALVAGQTEYHMGMAVELINSLKDYENQACNLNKV